MLLLVTLCLAVVTTIEANFVYYDGFTIEMPVWFELIPRLQPPMLAPFKETAGHPNALPNEAGPGRPQYPGQQHRAPQVDYSQPSGYPNYVQIQPKPIQFSGFHSQQAKPQEFYSPPKPPVVYSPPAQTPPQQRPTTSTTSTTFAPVPRAEDEYGEDIEEDSLLR